MSLKIALERIEKAKKGKARTLDLKGLGLKEIPIQIGNLVNLQMLDLENTQIQDLKPLEKLVNLQRLYLYNTQIQDLKPLEKLVNLQWLDLENTQIQDLKPLEKLVNLQWLSLSHTQIQDLKPLEKLVNLQRLYLYNTQIQDLKPLEKLVNLQTLYLSNTQIQDLKPLEKLVNLQELFLSNTQIQDLKPLEKLVNLQTLSLENTQIREIPMFLLDLNLPVYYDLTAKENHYKTGIYLKNTSLKIPPVHVVRKGNKAIRSFLEKAKKAEEERLEEEKKAEDERLEEEKKAKEAEEKRLEEEILATIRYKSKPTLPNKKIPFKKMTVENNQPKKIFISYSHKDRLYKDELVKHLKPFVRAKKIKVWDDGQIMGGQKWHKAIFDHLHQADLVLCLISVDFIDSDFCHEEELTKALEAHEEGRQIVIPIRIRECVWDILPISELQGYPANWMTKTNEDKLWFEVVKGIRRVLKI